SPQEAMLRHAAKFLKPGGVVIIAIENRLGAKYFQGCSEDHVSVPYYGICGYPDTPTARTFTPSSLAEMLCRVGFAHIERQYPYPDYKLTTSILSSKFIRGNPQLSSQIASVALPEDYSGNTENVFPYDLFLNSLQNEPD